MIAGSLTAGLVSVERIVICWCSAFWLFTMTEYGEPLGISLWAFLAFGAAAYLVIRTFLRRPRTMPALISLGIALAAAGTAGLLWKCSTLPGLTANAFGVLTTPCLEKINGKENVILEIDMARFSTSSKNKIAVRIEGDGEFSSGEVTVDRQEKALDSDLSAVQSAYKEFGVKVYPIVTMQDIIEAIEQGVIPGREYLERMKEYRAVYGA